MANDKEKSLLKISGVSSLRFKDEGILRSAFSKNSIRYSQSFLYLLRASHGEKGNLGYKYVDSDLTAVIGYRNNNIYITPISDHSGGIVLKKLCEEIFNKLHCQIYIKKFTQENFPRLKLLRKTFSSDKSLEDDTYPESLLKLSNLFVTLEGDINPTARKFIKKVKRFEKLSIDFQIIDDLKKIPENQIKNFFMKDYDKYINYLPIIKYLYSHRKDIRYKIMVFKNKNTIEGVYITEVFSLTNMGFYCGVTAKNRPGATEWMDWYFFQKVLMEGIRTIYLGGSETKGVMEYVEKLLPYRPDYYAQTVPFENFLEEDRQEEVNHDRKNSVNFPETPDIPAVFINTKIN